ncbi:MAG: lipopolysaccharide transport system ATP-binding protein [Maribacter sp.]|jgi:lipopolysaccharide transport system ATP-binding protein
MESIIAVKNIGKQYMIGGKQESYLSLRDSLYRMGKQLLKGNKEIFWALEDVSFDVAAGECLGIIGRNGAGKSTLLKILSRITPPSKGEITMRGRVASLLEVGTGFHPELTGRENIFLNGSILGMKNHEIKQAFDEIVDFSGVDQFLDTPLKHYSSGMQLRLAFSVAAHLNPEILLIDEILAVGDAAFQKKCLGKMDEVSKSGRTVIFVSHDMGAVQQLCSRGIWLKGGKVKKDAPIQEIITAYDKWTNESSDSIIITKERQSGSWIKQVSFSKKSYAIDDAIKIQLQVSSTNLIKKLFVGVTIHNERGSAIGSQVIDSQFSQSEKDRDYEIELNHIFLAPGRYFLSIAIAETAPYNVLDSLMNSISFDIIPQLNGGPFVWDKNFGDIIFNDTKIKKL